MYTTYILESIKDGSYYIGHTKDMEARLKRHNKGLVSSTKYHRPWKIVFTEIFSTKQEAYSRELKIKSYKGGNQFKKILFENKIDFVK